ncbi:Uncharacterized protein FKW44_020778 [Caligus rogercresseyi]|uniref:Uncharacterized protein n=1 Tax=Caligus rogercresseyi TaxID=217165 RepID=A0A7T8GQH8_CALRO|nr:Uncharacterized protein FKW44_020778 [Caligus rogercresseyi]
MKSKAGGLSTEEEDEAPDKEKEVFPKIGWRKTGNEVFPERRNQNLRPRPKQIKDLIPLGLRYSSWVLECRSKKLKPHIDSFHPGMVDRSMECLLEAVDRVKKGCLLLLVFGCLQVKKGI